MIKEALDDEGPRRRRPDPFLDGKRLLLLGFATSIDAPAVGLTLALIRGPVRLRGRGHRPHHLHPLRPAVHMGARLGTDSPIVRSCWRHRVDRHRREDPVGTPGGLTLRPVVAADGEALSAVARKSKAHWGYTPEQLANWWNQLTLDAEDLASRPAFAAVGPAGPVGFYTLRPGGDAWELDNLWVIPECIGQGVGRMLFEHALRAARRRRARR
jgi:GNAT superfamily N-acetyltransferase